MYLYYINLTKIVGCYGWWKLFHIKKNIYYDSLWFSFRIIFSSWLCMSLDVTLFSFSVFIISRLAYYLWTMSTLSSITCIFLKNCWIALVNLSHHSLNTHQHTNFHFGPPERISVFLRILTHANFGVRPTIQHWAFSRPKQMLLSVALWIHKTLDLDGNFGCLFALEIMLWRARVFV